MFKHLRLAVAAIVLLSVGCATTNTGRLNSRNAEQRNAPSISRPEVVKEDSWGRAAIHGRVLAPDGTPLNDAQAMGSFTSWAFSPCHANGSFELDDLAPGRHALMFWHRDYAPGIFGPVDLKADELLRGVEIRLAPGGFVSGTVRNEQGEAVENAHICIQRAEEPEGDLGKIATELLMRPMWQATSMMGHYSSDALLPGTYRISTPLGLAESLVEVRVGERIEGIDLVVGKGMAVKGHVLDWDDSPVENARITAPGNWEGILTDSDGRFELWGFEPGPCDIYVEADDFHGSSLATTAPVEDCQIQLVPRPVIHLRAVDRQTRQQVNVTGVSVDSASFCQCDPRSDEPVRVPLSGSGDYSLTLYADKYAPAVIDAVRVLDGEIVEELVVEMTQGTTLLFHVLDRQTGLPIEDACIKDEGKTDTRGRCTVEHLESGLHEFEISHPSFALQVITVETSELDSMKEVTVALDTGVTLRGQVLSKRTGEPIENAWVSLRKDELFTPHNTSRGEYCTRSRTDGSFSFRLDPEGEERLAPGRYTLDVSHKNYAPIHSQLTLDAEPGRFLPLALENGFRLCGSVMTRDGRPASRCSIRLTGMEGQRYCRAGQVNADGTYEVGHLNPGTYEVEIERWPAFDVSYVVISEDTRADFFVGGAAVCGVVTVADMRRYPNLLFIESQQRGFLWRGTRARGACDDDGAFRVEHLPPGTYTLGLDTRAMNAPNDALMHDIVLDDEDVSVDAADSVNWVRGTVRADTGRPAVFARVELITEPPAHRVEALVRELHSDRLPHVADDNGRFGIDCVPAGSHYLLVSKGAYATRAVRVHKTVGEDLTGLDVVLEPSCLLTIECRNPDGTISDSFWLAVVDNQGRPLLNNWVCPDRSTGEVLIASLGPGPYEIVAKAPDHAILRKNVVLVRGAVNHEQLDLEPGHTLEVIVVGQNGEPVSLAEVVLDTGDDVALSAELIRCQGVRTTDAQGITTLQHVVDGTCTVRVLADGFQHAEQHVRIAGHDTLTTITLIPLLPPAPTTPPTSSPASSS
ncbi:MAG: hypothetical protein JW889_08770 [Verrucomicrobia bacterium]|nr:hypothetical protein [Verrucomicrobiota bacterium]